MANCEVCERQSENKRMRIRQYESAVYSGKMSCRECYSRIIGIVNACGIPSEVEYAEFLLSDWIESGNHGLAINEYGNVDCRNGAPGGWTIYKGTWDYLKDCKIVSFPALLGMDKIDGTSHTTQYGASFSIRAHYRPIIGRIIRMEGK